MQRIWQTIESWWRSQNSGERLTAGGLAFLAVVFCFAFPDAMRSLILLGAGLVGWYFLDRRAQAADRNAQAAEQGVTVERLTRALEQLASDTPSIRLGGILGLERIAHTHEEERENIIQILSARIREIAAEDKEAEERKYIETAVFILAGIAEPLADMKVWLCRLQKANLRSFSLDGMDLSHFQMEKADFGYTRLAGTWLAQTNLEGAIFEGAYLDGANLENAKMDNTDFTGAQMNGANLTGTWLDGANFEGANISGANFRGASYLTQEQLDQAVCEESNPPRNLPEGLTPPASFAPASPPPPPEPAP